MVRKYENKKLKQKIKTSEAVSENAVMFGMLRFKTYVLFEYCDVIIKIYVSS